MLFWWPKFWAWQVFGTKPWQLTIGQDWTRTPPPFPWGSYKKRWDGGQGRLTTKRQLATSACCCCQKDKNRHGSRFSQIMFLTIWFMVLFWHLLFLILFLHLPSLEKITRKNKQKVSWNSKRTFYFWTHWIVWQMSQWSKRPPFAANEIDYWMVQKVHSEI